MDGNDLRGRLEFGLDVAREAGELILGYYRNDDLAVDRKGDATPVTLADRGAEELIRRRLGEEFPGDGVLGEELEDKPSESGFRWILDPIDGTKVFVRGVPMFGTLIGVEHGGRTVAGVCRFPAMDEVVYAAEGEGTWWQSGKGEPERCRVSETERMSDALFCTTTLDWAEFGLEDVLARLVAAADESRGWGDCYGHALVAAGRVDVMIDPEMSAWDAAALIPIVQEAGGAFVDWTGRVTAYGGNGVSVNGKLRDEVVGMLGGQ